MNIIGQEIDSVISYFLIMPINDLIKEYGSKCVDLNRLLYYENSLQTI